MRHRILTTLILILPFAAFGAEDITDSFSGTPATSAKAHANYLLRAELDAAAEASVKFEVAAGAVVESKVAPGSHVLEIACSRRKDEAGEFAAWLDGESIVEVERFGKAKTSGAMKASTPGIRFAASREQSEKELRMDGDFTAYVRFRSKGKGTLLSKCAAEGEWARDAKAFFLRGGRLTYDIGWKGQMAGPRVNDGKWHDAVLTSRGGMASIWLDGKKVAEKREFTRPDAKGHVFKIGAANRDFGHDFEKGEIANVRFWKRALDEKEIRLLVGGKADETNTPLLNWMPGGEKPPAPTDENEIIDGYVTSPIRIRYDREKVTLRKITIGELGDVDHARLIRGWDHLALERGGRIYNGLCITCHGDEKVEGTLPTALRFHKAPFKNGNDPYRMYQTLTKGFNLMVPQPWMTPRQKYDVIHYIRETFLKESNPSQYVSVNDAYLEKLPRGIGIGPIEAQIFGEGEPKWKRMDYGPVQFWTIEAEGGNIAYKGIAVRLDEGPGGVAKGNTFMLYDHDTMRVAAAWTGEGYINWRGIAFDQSHGSHAALVGQKAFTNPVGPGWGRPGDQSFEEVRMRGRDDKPYGPLPREWAHYKGLYMHGNRPVIKYTVGDAVVYETPGYEKMGDVTVFTRTLNVGNPGRELLVRLAPRGTAVMATGARLDVVKEFVCASIERAGRYKFYLAKAPQDQLAQYVKTAGEPIDLKPLTGGGPTRWPEVVTTEGKMGGDEKAFEIDEITYPAENPWNSWMRIGGFDFFPDGKRAAVATWLGDVFIVDGIDGEFGEHRWKRICAGLFQPLGVKIVEGKIHVACRDQIAKLHDLNGDEEIDFIESFNNDHQVTEHFHEFAMGLQTDDEGNFYYAKSARHAKTALVPHHGTLLRVDRYGKRTDILATGFRAANGVCLNPDGTYIVTDQEGHWNPKNRINYVKEGGFYGNMYGYHDVTDDSDEAMEQPLCWITNGFDRSPGELMWVPKDARWGPLNGHLLNLSYGTGRIFLVPHEKMNDGQAQGGMISLGLEFPTGIMRGRFHPENRQLYATGMFAWAGSKRQDGGFYRIRHTGAPAHLPVELKATKRGMRIGFTDPLDKESAANAGNWKVKTWALKRTKSYGSKHYDEKPSKIEEVKVSSDGKSVFLEMPEIQPTWCMEIQYKLKSAEGEEVRGTVHNSVHQLGS